MSGALLALGEGTGAGAGASTRALAATTNTRARTRAAALTAIFTCSKQCSNPQSFCTPHQHILLSSIFMLLLIGFSKQLFSSVYLALEAKGGCKPVAKTLAPSETTAIRRCLALPGTAVVD